MLKYTIGFATALAISGTASASILLWNNGPMVTHPGAGPGGVDVSMASSVPNAAGSNISATIWRADDFTVTGPGWIVNTVDMFAYDTGFADPRWQDATISIRQGAPDGLQVGSAAASWQLAGVNRVFNGLANLTNTQRQVNRLTADFGDLVLDPGLYWVTLTITLDTGGTAWFPYVMDPNPDNPDDPITRIGNSMFSTDSGVTWSTTVVATGMWNQTPEVPFEIHGSIIPGPGALALLGLAGLVGVRRRRN